MTEYNNGRGSVPRILRAVIVDDERRSREALTNLVDKYCPEATIVAMASSVDEALSTIKAYAPDLVFLDIKLSDGDSFEVLKLIPERTFRIIFATAYSTYRVQAAAFHPTAYLLKPININELQAAVAKAAHG